jgi:hypothetical protein
MTFPPQLRKTILVLHVAASVGWFGALVAYLALDITAAASTDIATVRSLYVAMAVIARHAIVPLALAAVLIGIINGLGTPWGLFRHYWVLVKLVITLVATGVLLTEVGSVTSLANMARSAGDHRPAGGTLIHSIGGLIVLATALVLSVFKPRGLTPYGWRKQRQVRTAVGGNGGWAERATG